MEAVLEHFNIDVTGMTCLDAGLSTGGFTDCLLQKGALKVYGVDVGFGQVKKIASICNCSVLCLLLTCRCLQSHPQGAYLQSYSTCYFVGACNFCLTCCCALCNLSFRSVAPQHTRDRGDRPSRCSVQFPHRDVEALMYSMQQAA